MSGENIRCRVCGKFKNNVGFGICEECGKLLKGELKEMGKEVLTMTEYSARLDKIIELKQSVPDTLMALLEEASKYKIKKEQL